jgi:hypothetical protein
MVYDSDQPMIPLRLTAVAAEADMDVTVWLLGSARAVPLNYPHVEVNYARLNWYQSFLSYPSYQSLVTEAMNEVGGLGFATDLAGPARDMVDALSDPQTLRDELDRVLAIENPAEGIASLVRSRVFVPSTLLPIYQRALPGVANPNDYASEFALSALFSADPLTAARTAIIADVRDNVVVPYETSLTVFDGDPYLTRMYTTLSPEEMSIDPCFSFNPDLPDQPRERTAKLFLDCFLGQTQWIVELGAGTGRDGEVILRGSGAPPTSPPDILADQSAVRLSQRMRETGAPETLVDNGFEAPFVANPGGMGMMPLPNLCGLFGVTFLGGTLIGLGVMRRRIRRS